MYETETGVRQLAAQFNMGLEERVSERTRIARELHDTLLQGAHGLLLRFQIVSQLLPGRPVEAKEKLDRAIEQTANFITEARDEVQGLRDSTIQNNDLALAISTLGEELVTDSTNHRPSLRVAVEASHETCTPSCVTRPTRLLPRRCGTLFGTPRHGRLRLKSAMTMSNSDCACGTMEKASTLQFSRSRAVRDIMACPVCGNAPHLWELS